MKKFFTISILVSTIFLTNNVFSQLSVKNSTSAPVYFCMGWYSESNSCFITKGWFEVQPGSTINPGLTFTSNNDKFYYYAYSEKAIWEDQYNLLVRPNNIFTITCADQKATQEGNPDFEFKMFREVEVSFEPRAEKKYTLELSITQTVQDYTEQAKIYFSKYVDSKAFAEIGLKSLPTYEDCRLIFKDHNAFTYFGFLTTLEKEMAEESQREVVKFYGVDVKSYNATQLGNPILLDKLQPNVIFYKVEFIEKDNTRAESCYWVKLDERWIFFHKPWRAFQ